DFKLETMVDTGATASSLTTQFLKDHVLDVEMTPQTVIGVGIGGATQGHLFRPTSVRVGSASFSKPVIGMTETKGGVIGQGANFNFLIGADFLKRFIVTFDYPHSRMYL